MFSDKILLQLIEKYPAPQFVDKSEMLYQSLIDSIIGQQLSIKAADTIFARFVKLFAPKEFPDPEDILNTKDDVMRSVGMSYAKISYVKAIAQAFKDEQFNIDAIKQMTDEEVIVELTKIKGVGRWTAEMVLIFTLNRPDVFSIGDLGLRRAIEKLYNITDRTEMLTLSQSWAPHRSTASWYLWRSLENKS